LRSPARRRPCPERRDATPLQLDRPQLVVDRTHADLATVMGFASVRLERD
jgi:hypothetical protein